MRRRFSIRFDGIYAALSSALLLPPSSAYVEVGDGQVHARMGWAFRVTFPLTAVTRTSMYDGLPRSRGVHGWGGRWLVNGSGEGIVEIALEPPPRAFVIGFPVRLRRLLVSVDDPAGLQESLAAPSRRAS